MANRRRSPIIPLREFDESINILVYGDSGIGKTVLGGTAENACILGLESGVISAKRQGSKADLWPVKKWDDVQRCFEWFRDNPDHGFKWLIIDSITDMQEKLLRYILDNAIAEAKGNRDPDIPAIQDHQKWQNMLKRFVNQFNDLPVNVLWTALTMKRETEEGEDIILPLLLGKDYEISQVVCGKMHVVGHMAARAIGSDDDRQVTRRIQFEHIPPYFAKDRYGCLPRFMANPTIPKIEGLIERSGGLKKPATTPPRARRRVAASTTKTTPVRRTRRRT